MHRGLSPRFIATAAAGALALAATPAAAQQGPATPPSITVGATVYGQFLYQLKDSAGVGHQNQFSIQRAYVNVIGRFGEVYTRVTADVAPPAGGFGQVYRLKYAYAGWTPTGSSLTYKFGLIQTPFLDWEEALWDYRMEGSMALDRNGKLFSADFGAGIDGNFNKDQVNGQLVVVNGEGYAGGPDDNRKDIEARVSYRVSNTDDASRVGGLRVTGYLGLGKTGAGNRNRYLGMLSYRSTQATLAGEFASTDDGGVKGSVLSVFGVYHATPKAAAIARVDLYDPNTSTSPNKQTRFIGGASYQLSPNLRLLADLDLLSFEGGSNAAQDGTRDRLQLQTQFTF